VFLLFDGIMGVLFTWSITHGQLGAMERRIGTVYAGIFWVLAVLGGYLAVTP
jgi:NADH:ubiquinone oxidoreductase subunit 3 (subunit A)